MSFSVNVDPTNPGQFFACCGLLELADRLWPGAEGWFANGQFHVERVGTLSELLTALSGATINSSLTDEELKRLGTLLSAEKVSLSYAQTEEKQRLSAMWKRERLHLSKPFDLWVDWWLDEQTGGKTLKTWAAKQLVLGMARPMLRIITDQRWSDSATTDILSRTTPVDAVPFYFDAHNNWQSTPRDVGIGLYTLRNVIKTQEYTRPLLELAAFLGIQRFRPAFVAEKNLLCFTLWPTPLPVVVGSVATTGLLNLPRQQRYAFRMLFRSDYMKAFLPAQPYEVANE